MLLTNIGTALFWVGFIFILHNIVPSKKDRQLMQEYELAKAKGEKPHTGAEYCHIRHLFFRIGVVIVGTGGLLWIIGYLLRGE